MPSEHFLDYKTSLAQKALLDYARFVAKRLTRLLYPKKKAQNSSKSHEMKFLQPKQTMN